MMRVKTFAAIRMGTNKVSDVVVHREVCDVASFVNEAFPASVIEV